MRNLFIPLATMPFLSSCTVINDEGKRGFHPMTDALLPDRFGANYKMNADGDYVGTNVGFIWGLNWDEWFLDE